MRISIGITLAVFGCSLLSNGLFAQVTNVYLPGPATKLESFETNVDIVVLKATTEVGSISADGGMLAIRSRQVTDTSTGNKEVGLSIELSTRDQPRDVMFVDYDELPAFLNAITYFSKLDVSVTPLNSFDAVFTTKGGFRLAALGTRRTGAIQFGVRDVRTGAPPVALTRSQLDQLLNLVNQAKATLDSLR